MKKKHSPTVTVQSSKAAKPQPPALPLLAVIMVLLVPSPTSTALVVSVMCLKVNCMITHISFRSRRDTEIIQGITQRREEANVVVLEFDDVDEFQGFNA
ncbi:hypothetical protein ACLOJK_004044 [Asimina triloba]